MARRNNTKKAENITIRGRMSTVYLARGQKVTVTLTETVQKMIDAGYVEKVNE